MKMKGRKTLVENLFMDKYIRHDYNAKHVISTKAFLWIHSYHQYITAVREGERERGSKPTRKKTPTIINNRKKT